MLNLRLKKKMFGPLFRLVCGPKKHIFRSLPALLSVGRKGSERQEKKNGIGQ